MILVQLELNERSEFGALTGAGWGPAPNRVDSPATGAVMVVAVVVLVALAVVAGFPNGVVDVMGPELAGFRSSSAGLEG